MVGYGTDTKLGNFWLLRNSKGAAWGEKGNSEFSFDELVNMNSR